MKAVKLIAACLLVLAFISAVAVAAPGGQANANWWGRAPGQKSLPLAQGVVAGVSPAGIAVQTQQGVKSFAVNARTRVVVLGKKAAIADVKAGNPVVVKFTPRGSAALAVGIVVTRPVVKGEVTAIQGNAITVRDKNGENVVLVDEKTRFHSKGYQGTIQDIKPRMRVSAIGVVNNNQFTASLVEFMPTLVKGAVVSVEGDVIKVKTIRQSILTLQASPKTSVLVRPRVGPNKKGTLEDVKAGAPVNVGFIPIKDGPSTLLWVDVLTAM